VIQAVNKRRLSCLKRDSGRQQTAAILSENDSDIQETTAILSEKWFRRSTNGGLSCQKRDSGGQQTAAYLVWNAIQADNKRRPI